MPDIMPKTTSVHPQITQQPGAVAQSQQQRLDELTKLIAEQRREMMEQKRVNAQCRQVNCELTRESIQCKFCRH